MMKTPLLATGLNGLVGSKFTQLYSDRYSFDNLDVSDPVRPIDITNAEDINRLFAASPAEFVIHMAAFTDVNAAWQQTGNTQGLAYQVNVKGTENIVKAAAAHGKHVIHISTALVFDGTKEDSYLESDPTAPIEWYGQTKAEAEAVVQASTGNWTILRIDYPFRSDDFPKPDIVRKTIAAIKSGIPLFDNHFFSPTYIDDLATVIDWVIRSQSTGLFNTSTGEKWSDFQLGQEINEILHLGLEVKQGDLNEYLAKTQRPYHRNTTMNCDKLRAAIDFKLRTLPEALAMVTLSHEN
jgi:dTDP-4-dehydrorhamnose reductase